MEGIKSEKLTGSVSFNGLLVHVFHSAGSSGKNQDRWLVQPLDRSDSRESEFLRVGVIDGVTPWRPEKNFVEEGDATLFAVSLTMGILASGVDLDRAFYIANKGLHNPKLRLSRKQAMAAAVAVDCSKDENTGGISYSAVISADCEIWGVVGGEEFVLLGGGDFISPEMRLMWEAIKSKNPDWTFDQRLSVEAELLDEPGTQIRHAIGRYADPIFESCVGVAEKIVIASDGLGLRSAVNDGRISFKDFNSWVDERMSLSFRDDLTCMIVEPE